MGAPDQRQRGRCRGLRYAVGRASSTCCSSPDGDPALRLCSRCAARRRFAGSPPLPGAGSTLIPPLRSWWPELVITNAVVHAHSTFVLSLRRQLSVVRLAVRGLRRDDRARAAASTTNGPHGRGCSSSAFAERGPGPPNPGGKTVMARPRHPDAMATEHRSGAQRARAGGAPGCSIVVFVVGQAGEAEFGVAWRRPAGARPADGRRWR